MLFPFYRGFCFSVVFIALETKWLYIWPLERNREKKQEISKLFPFGEIAGSAIKANARRIPFHDPTRESLLVIE